MSAVDSNGIPYSSLHALKWVSHESLGNCFTLPIRGLFGGPGKVCKPSLGLDIKYLAKPAARIAPHAIAYVGRDMFSRGNNAKRAEPSRGERHTCRIKFESIHQCHRSTPEAESISGGVR
jgi:hypothetical protein